MGLLLCARRPRWGPPVSSGSCVHSLASDYSLLSVGPSLLSLGELTVRCRAPYTSPGIRAGGSPSRGSGDTMVDWNRRARVAESILDTAGLTPLVRLRRVAA